MLCCDIRKQLVCYSKAISPFKKRTDVLVCTKPLWFQAGWLTVGQNQAFELKTKQWNVLLWLNITEMDKSVLCKNTFEGICHMFGFFSHLQMSGIWVNVVSRTRQKIPKGCCCCCCCCWTEATMWASQGNICVLTLSISKLAKSWLRKPQYGPEKKVSQHKLFKSRSCWLSQSPGIVKNTCWEWKFIVTQPGNSTHINLQVCPSSLCWNWTC